MRRSEINRKTNETDISLSLCLDGGEIAVDTGIGFFDHMLEALARHAGFGLKLKVTGDLKVDCHHTVEDTGIVLGQALKEAAGDKAGIARYGSSYIPMDEALAFTALDISGRGYISFDAEFPDAAVGGMDTCTVIEFMRAFALNAFVTLHIKSVYGANSHHIIEAMYKSLAHALKQALVISSGDILSTKGSL